MNSLNLHPGKLLQEYSDYVDRECKKCNYIKFCRGGCPYNALTITDGEVNSVDPHCIAYKTIFKEITKRATEEMLSGNLGMSNPDLKKKIKPGIMDLMIKPS